VTVEELLAQAAGETIRFAILSTHYRQPLDWTTESLLQAKTNLDRFYTALRDEEVNPSAASVHSLATLGDSPAASVDSEVLAALKDDLNTPAAIARLHELVHHIHTATHLSEKKQWQACLRHSGGLMGLLQKSAQEWFQGTISGQFSLTAEDIEKVIQARQQARQRRDFAQADALRQQLLEKGVILEDTPQGTSWRRA
jgi:cysteinyl-tRNA synthetase